MPQASPPEGSPRDARSAGVPRQPLKLSARVKGTEGPGFEVLLLNITANGVLLETAQRLAIGQTVVLDLGEQGQHAARIAWSCDTHHGCQFVRPLARAVVSAALLRGEHLQGKDPPSAVPESMPDPMPLIPAARGFGFLLAQKRRWQGMTQADLAAAVGVSKTTVCNWEKGHGRPRREALARLENLLGELRQDDDRKRTQSGQADAEAATGSRLADQIRDSKQAIADALGVPASAVSLQIRL